MDLNIWIANLVKKEPLKLVSDNGLLIRFLNDPPYDVQRAAVMSNGNAIQYVTDQTEELCWLAIKQSSYALEHIIRPSVDMCIYAVKKNPFVIQFIPWPSEDMQLLAVSRAGMAIGCIDDPSDHVIEQAIQQDGRAIQYILNPKEELEETALAQNPFAIEFIDQTPSRCWKALKQNPKVIEHISNPTPEMWIYAVRHDGYYLSKVSNQTNAICEAAIKQEPHAIKFVDPFWAIDNITEYLELCVQSLTQNPHTIASIITYHEQQRVLEDSDIKIACEMAVVNDYRSLGAIPGHWQTEALCKRTVEYAELEFVNIIYHIRQPSIKLFYAELFYETHKEARRFNTDIPLDFMRVLRQIWMDTKYLMTYNLSH